jgi:hypothetical protein
MHRVTVNILRLVTHLVTELFRDAIPNIEYLSRYFNLSYFQRLP